ncbi:hypothetical protein [Kitasatospora sp. NPDC056531]|uniref:hypothetical protein n=1 Tax=Kitasatospora sp. NPDC056531 TaxID=3345856 RepID=UPI003676CE06
MILQPETDDLAAYLAADEAIDHHAQYDLQAERLAWSVRPDLGERDYPGILATPPAPLLHALAQATPGRPGFGYLPSDLPGTSLGA